MQKVFFLILIAVIISLLTLPLGAYFQDIWMRVIPSYHNYLQLIVYLYLYRVIFYLIICSCAYFLYVYIKNHR